MKGKSLKDKLKNIIMWRPDMRLVAALFVVALVLLLIPLVRMAIYSVPWYDDYNYGKFVKGFLSEERSLQSALKGAQYCTKTMWYAWQGTFSSIFLMSLVPLIWGEEYYFLGALFLIGILTVSMLIFVKSLSRNLFQADAASGVALAAGVTAMTVVLIHHPHQGFYWYNAGIHYIGMHSLLLLTIAAWVKLVTGAGKLKSALLIAWTLLGAVCAGGANYVTSLQGFLVGGSIIALGLVLRKKRVWLLLPSMLVYGYGFYKNMSAPGNAKRSAIYRDSGMSTDVVSAVTNSFVEAARFMKTFNWQMTLMVVILLAPIIWRIVKKSKCRFRYPGILLLWSVCLYATGFTSSLYVTGAVALARVVNAIKITYQILVIANEIYWLGWICRKLEQRTDCKNKWLKRLAAAGEGTARPKGAPLAFFAVAGMVMLGIFAMDPIKVHHYSSWAAYYYVHTGEANEFHKQYLERVEAIKNGGGTVIVEPYVFRPWILAIADLSEDPNAESNVAMAEWYHKEAILCIHQEEEE